MTPRARRLLRAAPLLLCLALRRPAPLSAQIDLGAGVGPEVALPGADGKPRSKQGISPLALAVSLACDATTWSALQLSTSSPASDIQQLLARGYYRLELLEMLTLARRHKVPLKSLEEGREKGRRLRELAKELGEDFDSVYEEAMALDAELERRWLPSVMSVSSSGPPAETHRRIRSLR